MNKFTRNISPHVKREIGHYKHFLSINKPHLAFKHLENAHVLGQESTYFHVLTHLYMARWALNQNNSKEFLGQLIRIIGAATKTAIGLVPTGNTGGTNVSPFKPLPLSSEHRALISQAKNNA